MQTGDWVLATTLLFLDIDDCATNNGGCDINAVCVNTVESYFCYCKLGYVGNGFDYCSGMGYCFVISVILLSFNSSSRSSFGIDMMCLRLVY